MHKFKLINTLTVREYLYSSPKTQRAAKPNVVVNITDQQYDGKMKYRGDKWLSTPTKDSFLRRSILVPVTKQGRYKNTVFEAPTNPDMFIDTISDPGELTNRPGNPKHAVIEAELKAALNKSLSERGIKLKSE